MITRASLSDVNQIAVLNRQFHLDMPYFPWDTPEWIEQEIRAGHYYVIRDADGIVGALCLHTNSQSGVAEIEAMATRANLHGQGIGRLLVEYAITLSRALNLRSLTVGSFCAYGVRPFYEKCGFTCAAETRQYQGHQYFSFSLTL